MATIVEVMKDSKSASRRASSHVPANGFESVRKAVRRADTTIFKMQNDDIAARKGMP
jgi:hypothetical protein